MNSKDHLLFHASTEVTMGDGKKAKFWYNIWLQGAAPRVFAPQLFGLVKRKNKTVEQELRNNNWIKPFRGKITEPCSSKNLFPSRSTSIELTFNQLSQIASDGVGLWIERTRQNQLMMHNSMAPSFPSSQA